jgi:hypothetical protein
MYNSRSALGATPSGRSGCDNQQTDRVPSTMTQRAVCYNTFVCMHARRATTQIAAQPEESRVPVGRVRSSTLMTSACPVSVFRRACVFMHTCICNTDVPALSPKRSPELLITPVNSAVVRCSRWIARRGSHA